jgi:hypothetical protein
MLDRGVPVNVSSAYTELAYIPLAKMNGTPKSVLCSSQSKHHIITLRIFLFCLQIQMLYVIQQEFKVDTHFYRRIGHANATNAIGRWEIQHPIAYWELSYFSCNQTMPGNDAAEKYHIACKALSASHARWNGHMLDWYCIIQTWVLEPNSPLCLWWMTFVW